VTHQGASSKAPGSGLLRLLAALCGQDKLTLAELESDPRYHDPRVSQSVLNSLLVLTPFASKSEHKVTKLAAELGMSPSTAVRYLKTWVAIGALKQDRNGPYRLAVRLPGDPVADFNVPDQI
jgi:Fic family protein